MRKLLTLGVLGLFMSFGSQAQSLSQGQSNIQMYYGMDLNLGFQLISAIVEQNGGTALTTSALGPIGLRYSYMTSEKASVGLDINYTDLGVDYTETDSISGTTYTSRFGRKLIRIMPRLDFHFAGGENFDAYFGIAAGYRSPVYYSRSTNPNHTPLTSEGLVPLAFRAAVGGQYFFSPNIGLMMEVGLFGGGALRGGLSMKF